MLLRTGIVMMTLALVLAGSVAVFALLDGRIQATAVKSAAESAVELPARSDPGVEPWKEEIVALPVAEAQEPEPELEPEPQPAPDPESRPEPGPAPEPVSTDTGDPPEPTPEEIEATEEPRHYDLPDGAVLGLTVKALGLRDVPVFDSIGEQALRDGVGHHPETSMPWSDAPQRNVYIAGHRLGFPGTASHLIFNRLGDLGEGDEILLKDRDGDKYRYRVNETFKAGPEDSWVMGQVVNRDMVTLQTCTGPGYSRRLIVRADRVLAVS